MKFIGELNNAAFPIGGMYNNCSKKCLLYFRICKEFQTVFDRASKTPESSEELVEMISFIESARNVEVLQLTEAVQVSSNEHF